jgi:hypothetical protein
MLPTVASDDSVSLIQQLLNNTVAARWYQMGVVLGVPPSDLEIIRESPEYHGAGEREGGMLKAWLERGMLPRTWQVQYKHISLCLYILRRKQSKSNYKHTQPCTSKLHARLCTHMYNNMYIMCVFVLYDTYMYIVGMHETEVLHYTIGLSIMLAYRTCMYWNNSDHIVH